MNWASACSDCKRLQSGPSAEIVEWQLRSFFFQKPTDAIVLDGGEVPYPSLTSDFQFEAELALAIGENGSDIPEADAARHIFGFAAGIDMTRRDLQVAARKAGRPWEIGNRSTIQPRAVKSCRAQHRRCPRPARST